MFDCCTFFNSDQWSLHHDPKKGAVWKKSGQERYFKDNGVVRKYYCTNRRIVGITLLVVAIIGALVLCIHKTIGWSRLLGGIAALSTRTKIIIMAASTAIPLSIGGAILLYKCIKSYNTPGTFLYGAIASFSHPATYYVEEEAVLDLTNETDANEIEKKLLQLLNEKRNQHLEKVTVVPPKSSKSVGFRFNTGIMNQHGFFSTENNPNCYIKNET